MKKAILLIVGILLLSIFLTACGTTDNGTSPSTSPSVAVTTTTSSDTSASPSADATTTGSPVTSSTPTDTGSGNISAPPTTTGTGTSGMTLQDFVDQLQAAYTSASNDSYTYSAALQGNNIIITMQVLTIDTAVDAGDPSTYASTLDGVTSSLLPEIQTTFPQATLTLTATAADGSVIYSGAAS